MQTEDLIVVCRMTETPLPSLVPTPLSVNTLSLNLFELPGYKNIHIIRGNPTSGFTAPVKIVFMADRGKWVALASRYVRYYPESRYRWLCKKGGTLVLLQSRKLEVQRTTIREWYARFCTINIYLLWILFNCFEFDTARSYIYEYLNRYMPRMLESTITTKYNTSQS